MRALIYLATTAAVSFIALHCGIDDRHAGSGSQTTNGVTVAAYADSIVVTGREGLNVMLFAGDYVPIDTPPGYSDTASILVGRHRFPSLPHGFYSVLTIDENSGNAALFQEVPVGDSIFFEETDTLRPTGSISGTVLWDETPRVECSVYSEGTPFSSATDESGRYRLSSVPVGSYHLSVWSTEHTDTTHTDTTGALPTTVSVTADSLHVTDIDLRLAE
ncbi:MAG: hypothetical protein JW913_12380 [Chitinispirillaceae bacterium]|nr:hypothetical protein [Chitinispirillaceae bacterium]